MVLTRNIALFIVLALLVTGVSCIQKPDAVKLTQPAGVTTAFVVSFPDRPDTETAPDTLVTAVIENLGRRNLQTKVVPPSEEFARKRATQDRLELLAASSNEPFVLLVETRVAYYSLISGRYRWDIFLKTTIAPREKLAEAQSQNYELSASLDFDHQDHVEALEYAARPIADRVGRVVDQFLNGLDDATVSRPAAKAARDQTDAAQQTAAAHPLAPGAVIYFAMVDRFANGDPTNDGEVDLADPHAFHGGDLQGIRQHLDWLSQLGVTTLWLSPVFEMRDEKFHGHGAFHGYWVEDFGRIEDRFGGEKALRELSQAAATQGITLMLDVVLNHVSFDAPLVTDKPDWFHRNGGIQDWADRSQIETHDVHGLPDLAQENVEVYNHLLEHSLHWVDVAKPAGFRLDAVKHVPGEFWTKYNADVKARAGPGFVLLGEDLDGNPASVARTMRDGKFDAMFDFPLHFAMVDVFCRDAHPGRLASILYADRLYPDNVGERREGLVTLLDNHDLSRILSACGNDVDRVRDAVIFMLSARGTPSFTWGTESGALGATEPGNRGDMVFAQHPVGDTMRKWIALRRKYPVLTHGTDRLVKLDDDTFVYHRTHRSQTAAIVLGQAADLGPGWTALDRGSRVTVLVREDAGPQKTSGSATMKFVVDDAPPGTVKIVGSGPELGDWDPVKAPNAGEVRLPNGGVFAFKVVIVDGPNVTWQPGDNNYILVAGDAEMKVAWKP